MEVTSRQGLIGLNRETLALIPGPLLPSNRMRTVTGLGDPKETTFEIPLVTG